MQLGKSIRDRSMVPLYNGNCTSICPDSCKWYALDASSEPDPKMEFNCTGNLKDTNIPK